MFSDTFLFKYSDVVRRRFAYWYIHSSTILGNFTDKILLNIGGHHDKKK